MELSPAFGDIPVELPPKGQTANFNDPKNLNTISRVMLSIATGLVLFFVALRIYTRLSSRTRPSLDDCKSGAFDSNNSLTIGRCLFPWDCM